MIQFFIARSRDEFISAAKLVMYIYAGSGYVPDSSDVGEGISAYIGKKDTVTFLACAKEVLLGTISVASDSSDRLPMDAIYAPELDALRDQGKRIAEVCQFAVDATVLKKLSTESEESFSELDVSIGLLGFVVHFGLYKKFDYLCFAVNPKHASFYESLGCTKIGEERTYPSVNQAPAIAYVLDMHALIQATAKGIRRHFLIEKILQTPPAPRFFDDV